MSHQVIHERTEPELRRLAIFLALLWLALVLGSLRAFTFDLDSANYSLGVWHFDIGQHQPQPPGYPLWILAAKIVTVVVRDARIAQTLLAAGFALGAIGFFFLVSNKLLGAWGALACTSLLAFSPPVLLNSSVQDTYTVDLFASCFIAWLVISICEGHLSRLPVLYLSAAVLAGFRPSAVEFLAPILIFATLTAIGHKCWRELGIGILLAGATGAAWLFPTAQLTGGFAKWGALTQTQVLWGARSTSLFYGAPSSMYWPMVGTAAVQLMLALFPAVLFSLLWRFLAPTSKKIPSSQPQQKWDRWFFYLLWAAPCLLFDFLIHCPKAGYLLLSLPPLFLVTMKATRKSIVRFLETDATPRAWFPCLLGGVAISLLLAYVRTPSDLAGRFALNAANLGRPEFSFVVEEGHEELQSAFGSATNEVLVFSLRPSNEAPNYRTLSVDFPRTRLATILDQHPILITGDQLQPLAELSSRLKTIYWITWPDDVPTEIRQTFPQTIRVLRNSLFALWRTDLGPDPLDETLMISGVSVRLRRAANLSLMPPARLEAIPRITLLHGFGGVEGDSNAQWVWAMGPEATVSVKLPDKFTDTFAVTFEVMDATPGETGKLLLNGKLLQTFQTLDPRQVIRVPVPNDVNPATITFQFDRWNGHPVTLAPQDPRPMAVRFGSIRAESGGLAFDILQ